MAQSRTRCLKKNQNAPRPSEHPPVREEKCQNVVVYLTLTGPLRIQLLSQDRRSYTKTNRGQTRSEKKKKNREESRQKEAGVEVACRGHHRQEGIQEGKKQGTKTKQTRATTYNTRRARKATIYIYK